MTNGRPLQPKAASPPTRKSPWPSSSPPARPGPGPTWPLKAHFPSLPHLGVLQKAQLLFAHLALRLSGLASGGGPQTHPLGRWPPGLTGARTPGGFRRVRPPGNARETWGREDVGDGWASPDGKATEREGDPVQRNGAVFGASSAGSPVLLGVSGPGESHPAGSQPHSGAECFWSRASLPCRWPGWSYEVEHEGILDPYLAGRRFSALALSAFRERPLGRRLLA